MCRVQGAAPWFRRPSPWAQGSPGRAGAQGSPSLPLQVPQAQSPETKYPQSTIAKANFAKFAIAKFAAANFANAKFAKAMLLKLNC